MCGVWYVVCGVWYVCVRACVCVWLCAYVNIIFSYIVLNSIFYVEKYSSLSTCTIINQSANCYYQLTRLKVNLGKLERERERGKSINIKADI